MQYMREDRRAKQLAHLAAAQQRSQARLDAQRRRIDERFARVRQRITSTEDTPSDDQQRIIDAALELLDEVGLQELSLRKLAAKLDIQAPALYWYFKNKEDLTDYMAEAILKKEFVGTMQRQDDEPWQDWLVTACKRLRKAMLAYRDGGRVVTGAHFFPATTLLDFFEMALASLVSAGVSVERAGMIAVTAVHFTFGRVIEEQSMPSAAEIADINRLIIGRLQQSHPHVATYRQHQIETGMSMDDEFDDALRLIIHNSYTR